MTPAAQRPARFAHPLDLVGLTACVVGGILLGYALMAQATLATYRDHGIRAEALVHAKGRSITGRIARYEVRVGFWVGSILDGGDLVLTTIDEFVRPDTWSALQSGDEVTVVYLLDDPEQQVVLADSLDPATYAPIERVELGAVLLGVGLICLLVRVLRTL